MGAFTYPTFAVCVVIYNIVAALGSFICSWLSPAVVQEKVSTVGKGSAHYSLIVVDDKAADLLLLFPEARFQNSLPSNLKEQFWPIDSRMESMEIQTSIKENKHVESVSGSRVEPEHNEFANVYPNFNELSKGRVGALDL